jgi:hypothetical protein
MGSKSRSACSSTWPLRMQKVAIITSMVLRIVIPPQQPIALSARQRELATEHIGVGQLIERTPRPLEIAFIAKPL